uniref:Chitin-binding type-2 domain-containing protein n=1 Tax=Anopheles coluzzii TaxID=1518534 RepID=A0A6E8W1A8_ANOCL|nr:mucin-2-like [Anopheles coluzzii]
MRTKLVVVVLASVALVSVTGELRCVQQTFEGLGGVFPSPRSSSEYSRCDAGVVQTVPCPDGHYFDTAVQICLLGQMEEQSHVEVAFQFEELCNNPDVVQIFPNPTNCTQYILCYGTVPIVQSCSGGLLFNPQLNTCDVPGNVVCGYSCPSVDDPYNPVWLPDARLQDCSRHYLCFKGEPLQFQCYSNLYFDIETRTCTYPQYSTCRVPNVYCNTTLTVNVENPRSCTSYYTCVEGFPHYRTCGYEEYFSVPLGMCIPGTCGPDTTTTVGPSTVTVTELTSTTGPPGTTPSLTSTTDWNTQTTDFTSTTVSISTITVPESTTSGLETTTSTISDTSTMSPTTPEISTFTPSTPELTTNFETPTPTIPNTSSTPSITPETSTFAPSTPEPTTDLPTMTPSTPGTSTISPTTPEFSTFTPSTPELTTNFETPTPTIPDTSSTPSITPETSTFAPSTPEPTTDLPTMTPSTPDTSTISPTTPEFSTFTPSTPELTTDFETTTPTTPDTPSTTFDTTTLAPSTAEPTTEPSTISTDSTTTTVELPTTTTTIEQTTTTTPDPTTTTTEQPTTTTPEPTTTTEMVTIDPSDVCPELGVIILPYPTNCYMYILCLNGVGGTASCKANEIFNPITAVCVPGNQQTCTPS